MDVIGIAVRLVASLVGAACTYAFAAALMFATSFGDFVGHFVGSLAGLVTDPFAPPQAGVTLSLTPYVFVAAMAAFYFCFPLIADFIRRRTSAG